MKTLNNINTALQNEFTSRINDFDNQLAQCTTIAEVLSAWRFKNLLTKTTQCKDWANVEELKAYVTKRHVKQQTIALNEKLAKVSDIANSGDLKDIKIQVEWKRSAMWGSNPNAELWMGFKNSADNYDSKHFTSGSIGGCGYDKLSTAVANVLNQCKPLLKALYEFKDANIETKNHDLFGYGSGYGLLPQFEGGVGVSCYNDIFNKIGFEFKSVASGKTFDVFEVKPLNVLATV
jgi:hypothetical protein